MLGGTSMIIMAVIHTGIHILVLVILHILLLLRVFGEEVVSQRKKGSISVWSNGRSHIRLLVTSDDLSNRRAYLNEVHDELVFGLNLLFEFQILEFLLGRRETLGL